MHGKQGAVLYCIDQSGCPVMELAWVQLDQARQDIHSPRNTSLHVHNGRGHDEACKFQSRQQAW